MRTRELSTTTKKKKSENKKVESSDGEDVNRNSGK